MVASSPANTDDPSLYRTRSYNLNTTGGRANASLAGYLTCALPPVRACVLAAAAAANATLGAAAAAAAARRDGGCCSGTPAAYWARRWMVPSWDAGTVLELSPDVVAALLAGGGSGGGGGGGCPCQPNATTGGTPPSDAALLRLLQPALAGYAQACRSLERTDVGGVLPPPAPRALATTFHVPEWCALARWQPQVLTTLAALDPVTALLPTHGAFARLHDGSFPAFWSWLASWPSCRGGFNRMEVSKGGWEGEGGGFGMCGGG
jgi:hypothetical protein